MKSVQFLRKTFPHGANFAAYQPGDVAGFEDKLADDLVASGSAKVYVSPVDKQSDGRTERSRGKGPVTK